MSKESKTTYERSAITTQIVGAFAVVLALMLAGAIIYSRPAGNQIEAGDRQNPVSQGTPSSLNGSVLVTGVTPTAELIEPQPTSTFFSGVSQDTPAPANEPAPLASVAPTLAGAGPEPSPTFFGAATLTAIAAKGTPAPVASVAPTSAGSGLTSEVELVEEHKLRDLFPSSLLDDDEKLSASGVFYHEGYYYVVFDNLTPVAKIAEDLALNAEIHQLINRQSEITGDGETNVYEDITFNENDQHFYVLVEALLDDDGFYKAKIEEYTAEFEYLNSAWLPFWLESANKGFEGLAYVRRDENDYLLALCEGNNCRDGVEGRTPGNGRIQIFRKEGASWLHEGTLNIPPTVRFEDYAGLAIKDNRLAVVSQASGQIWIGTLQEAAWGFVESDDAQPTIYRLPDATEAVYCNAEGISWITSTQIVVVSDRAQKNQSYVCWPKDQSIHIFNLP